MATRDTRSATSGLSSSLWLGRFRRPNPVRCRGAFHVYSALGEDESPRVVVVAAADADPVASEQSLRKLAHVHSLACHELFAPLEEFGIYRGQPYVSLLSAGVTDCEVLVQRLVETKKRLRYSEAMGLATFLSEATIAAHATTDPVSSSVVCLGSLCWANLLVAPDGSFSFVGLGYNVAAFNELGMPSGASVFQSPESATGGDASTGGDIYVLVAFFRSMFPFIDFPKQLRAVIGGDGGGKLSGVLEWVNQSVLAAPRRARPSVAQGLSMLRVAWKILGVKPDRAGLERRLSALVGAMLIAAPEAVQEERNALVVDRGVTWLVAPDGVRYELASRTAPRRVLRRLVQEAQSGDALVSLDELLEAGWPGEQPVYETGRNRVHVALAALRKTGLRDVIQRLDGGYRIDPRQPVRIVD